MCLPLLRKCALYRTGILKGPAQTQKKEAKEGGRQSQVAMEALTNCLCLFGHTTWFF